MMELREKVARKIADIRGLVQWGNLPETQTFMSGWACKETCFILADQILTLIKEAGCVKQEKEGKTKNPETYPVETPGPRLRHEIVDSWMRRTGGDRTN